MGWSTHATGTQDPPEVRNWKIHLVAFVASMSALASQSSPFHIYTFVDRAWTVGYDTSVIGGTMALDSFRRDFGLADASPTHRDTVQGNIVSTFQVRVVPFLPHVVKLINLGRLAASSEPFSPFRSRKSMAVGSLSWPPPPSSWLERHS